jgi:hypothetical protein
MPRELEATGGTIQIRGLEPTATDAARHVVVASERALREVEWFPAPPGAIEVDDIRIEPSDRGRQIDLRFRVRSIPGQSVKEGIFHSVLAYTSDDGRREGVILPIPIAPDRANR